MKPDTLIFDINETLLDMAAVKDAVAGALGDEKLVPLWFTTLLHHSLVDSASGRFHNFSDIGAAALVMVGHAHGVSLDADSAKNHIVPAMTSIPPHDDVVPALTRLKQSGFKLVALSNSAQQGLEAQLSNAKVDRLFDTILSVEAIRQYKPHASVYQWAVRQTDSDRASAMMVAAHGWDTSGAKAAGLQAAFVRRAGKMEYPLGIAADLSVANLTELADKLC